MIFTSLQFWTMIVAVLMFVVRFFNPAFPLDNAQILAAVLFVLGLLGVVPTLRARGVLATDIFKSIAFWTLVAGLFSFVIHFYAPAFPLSEVALLAVIVFVLGAIGITPQVRALQARSPNK